MNLDERTVYVFVRQDLPLAQQVIQALHAAWTAGVHFGWELRDLAAPSGVPFNVTIGMPDWKALSRVVRKLKENVIQHYIFSDPDITDAPTAIATMPLTKEQKLPLANYRLWRYSPGASAQAEACSVTADRGANADVAQTESTPFLTERSGRCNAPHRLQD